MPIVINAPTMIEAAGSPPKQIAEYVGRASTPDTEISIAYMRSPAGWAEPPQTPEFDEISLVITGTLVVEDDETTLEVAAGSAVLVAAGKQVRYRTPRGAEYVAICRPAFSPELANRQPNTRSDPAR